MPVYGLPLSLEASLNSLVELRPPTSWRVSGHGDEVTVVLRWTLSGSPSSDKTLDYDMVPGPRSSVQVGTSSLWARGIKQSDKLSPGADIKTRSSSVHDLRRTSSVQSKYDCLQPFKLRKLDTVSQLAACNPSPVPVYITVADRPSPSLSPGSHRQCHPLVCEDADAEPVDNMSLAHHHQTKCESQRNSQTQTPAPHLRSQNHSPIADTESREVLRTYLTPCSSDVSLDVPRVTLDVPDVTLDVPSVTLDEKSGLFTNVQQLLLQDSDGKVNGSTVDPPALTDTTQNDSGCASESNSTSLSHYVKQTLSHDSRSQDGSSYKSGSTSRNHQVSPADNRCSSVGSSVSRASFALQSCSSKTKVESVGSSSESERTSLMDEKDDDSRSQDLDMICSNEAEHEQTQARSLSTRSSISYWDSFDSFHSDLLPPEADASQQVNRDVTNDCLSRDNSQHGSFTV